MRHTGAYGVLTWIALTVEATAARMAATEKNFMAGVRWSVGQVGRGRGIRPCWITVVGRYLCMSSPLLILISEGIVAETPETPLREHRI